MCRRARARCSPSRRCTRPAPPGWRAVAGAVGRHHAVLGRHALHAAAAGAAHMFAGAPPEALKAFAADRAAVDRRHDAAQTPADATVALTGLPRPARGAARRRPRLPVRRASASIADFSVAHRLWFIHLRAAGGGDPRRRTAKLRAWYERVAAFGHGDAHGHEERRGDRARRGGRRARAGAGRAGPRLRGRRGRHRDAPPTTAATRWPARWSASTNDEVVDRARTTSAPARVHVHFPRIGFQIRKEAEEP